MRPFHHNVTASLVLVSLMAAGVPAAHAGIPTRLQAVSLPGSARSLSLAIDDDAGRLYVGTARSNLLHELFALDTGVDRRSLALSWSLDIGTHANAIAAHGSHLYVATSANDGEMLVVDTALRQVVGRFDAAGTADARAIEVVAPGVVLLSRRRGQGPEILRLDVSDPAHVQVLEAREDARGAKMSRPDKLARYPHRGRLQARIDREVPQGVLHYLAITDRDAEVQLVELRTPVVFADANGDGVFRLGCLGDSNTVDLVASRGWCERLEARLAQPDFDIVNVSGSGATATANLVFQSDAAQQMETVLGRDPDAVVLAFGTNDLFQGRVPTQIHDAIVDQCAVAEQAGLPCFVATIPPFGPCTGLSCLSIAMTNLLLHETFGDRVLEFFDGLGLPHLLDDWYHLNDLGRQVCADRAFELFAHPIVTELP